MTTPIQTTAYPSPGQGLTLDANGQLPAAVKATLPGYEYAYAQITSAVAVTATVPATPNTIVSAPELVFDGATTVMVEFYSPAVYLGAGANSSVALDLWDSTTRLGEIAGPLDAVDGNIQWPVRAAVRITPSAGAHTYLVRAYRNIVNGSVVAGLGQAGTYDPAYIRVYRV